MTGPINPGSGSADDAGTPVGVLRDLELDVDETFAGKVGRRIERRALTNELVTLAYSGPLAAAMELLHIPFAWFAERLQSKSPPRQ